MQEVFLHEVPEQTIKVDKSRFQATDELDVQTFVLQYENVSTKKQQKDTSSFYMSTFKAVVKYVNVLKSPIRA